MVRDGIDFDIGDFPFPMPFGPMPSGKSPRFAVGLADEMLTGGLGDKRINLLALFGNERFMDRSPEQVLDYFVGEDKYSVEHHDSIDKVTGIEYSVVLYTVPNVLQHLPKQITALLMKFGGYARQDPLQGLPLNDLFEMLQIPRRQQAQPLPASKAVIKFEEFVPGASLKSGYAPRGWRLEVGHKGDERCHTLDVKLSSGDDPSPIDRWSVYLDRVSYQGPEERLLYERKPTK